LQTRTFLMNFLNKGISLTQRFNDLFCGTLLDNMSQMSHNL